MSDSSVARTLRSVARSVAIEAPAGCGKTHQAADFARSVAGSFGGGRVLILAHTHAACDEFASRCKALRDQIEVRTIDSIAVEVAAAYYSAVGVPADPTTWVQGAPDRMDELLSRVAKLLSTSRPVARSIVLRYPVVICDEHQDSSTDQHIIVRALLANGSMVRLFGDPMQAIFGTNSEAAVQERFRRWETIRAEADVCDDLDEPHRWSGDRQALGRWLLAARGDLRQGRILDLSGSRPAGLDVLEAENDAPRHGAIRYSQADARRISDTLRRSPSILVLTSQNETVKSLRGAFGGRIPIWEGNVRPRLNALLADLRTNSGNPTALATSVATFLGGIGVGFSRSAFGECFVQEVREGCARTRRGKARVIQQIGRFLLNEPDHRGVSRALSAVLQHRRTTSVFGGTRIDYPRELSEAIQLGAFEDLDEGLATVTHRRTYSRLGLPPTAISTIHKAKGLETSDVLVVPCDADHFDEGLAARCRLYVALSRAKRTVTVVVSRSKASPLLRL